MNAAGGSAHSTARARPLQSPDGWAAIEQLVSARALYAFDFDGTLAPIVARPDDARMSTPMDLALRHLARRAPVAVITGRAVSDMRGRVPPEVRVVGNHGNEGLDVRGPDRSAAVAWCRAWVTRLRERQLDPGVEIEDKGMSLSVHYRLAADPVGAEARIRAAIAALDPAPKVIDGKCVVNLLAPNALTKRDALAALVAQAGSRHALFVGDDATDEYVFANAPHEWVTVRVEPAGDTAARWFLSSQADVLRLIVDVAALLHRPPA